MITYFYNDLVNVVNGTSVVAKATSCTKSVSATNATTSSKAGTATYATSAGSASKATTCTNAGTANYAKSAPNYKGATTAASGTAGFVPAATTATRTRFLRGDGTWQVPNNTTYSNMTGASASGAGKAGLVPAPAAGYNLRFLRGDGIWADPVLSGVGTVRYNESTDMIQVYTGSGWVDWRSGFNSGYVYNNGTYDNIPKIGYSSSSYNSFAINSNHIYLKRESGDTATCNMVFTNPVNLTKYSKLILKSNLKITRSDNKTNLVLGVSPTAIGSTTVELGCSKYKISTDVNSTSYVLTSVELDISDITGNYYVYIQVNVSMVQGGTYGEAQILEVYMI